MSPPRYVYLAGPITNVPYDAANHWRSDPVLQSVLKAEGWATLSPLANIEREGPEPLDAWCEGTDANDIVDADLVQILHSRAILANLMAHEHGVSIGTVAEIAYAWSRGLPVFTARQPGGPYDHPFIEGMSTEVSCTLHGALERLLAFTTKLVEPQYA